MTAPTRPTGSSRTRVGGRVTVVQEQRFRLISDDDRSLLLTLAHDANLGGADLCRLRDDAVHVVVEYSGEPGLASAVAYRVTPT